MAKEKKYIVKNCPAKVDVYCYYGWDNGRNYEATCQNVTDCLLKKIIQTTNDKNVLELFEIEVKNG